MDQTEITPDFDPSRLVAAPEESDAQTASENLADFGYEDSPDSEESFHQMIAAGTLDRSVPQRAHLPRYGVAMLLDIPLINDSKSQFHLGNFHIPADPNDPTKGTKQNIAFFPRLRVMPFTSKTFKIPFEARADSLTEEEVDALEMESYDPATVKATQLSANRISRLSAERFALKVYDRYKNIGYVYMHSVTGQMSYSAVTDMLDIVLPRDVLAERYPSEPRMRLGHTEKAPFIPDIVDWLRSYAPAWIDEHYESFDRDTLQKMRAELLVGSQRAATLCQRTLARTESDIAKGEKVGYDLPDFENLNPPPPLDLVAMCHLNRQPADLKALEVAETMGRAFHDSSGVSSDAKGAQNGPSTSTGDVKAIVGDALAENDAKWEKRFAEMDARYQNTIAEVVENRGNLPESEAAAPAAACKAISASTQEPCKLPAEENGYCRTPAHQELAGQKDLPLSADG